MARAISVPPALLIAPTSKPASPSDSPSDAREKKRTCGDSGSNVRSKPPSSSDRPVRRPCAGVVTAISPPGLSTRRASASSVTGSQTNNLRVLNNVSTAGTLTVNGSTFTTTDATNGGDAVSVISEGTGNLTVKLTGGNNLNSSQGDGLQASTNNSGVMNLTVIAALTAFVALEKLVSLSRRGAAVSGVLLLAAALWVALH